MTDWSAEDRLMELLQNSSGSVRERLGSLAAQGMEMGAPTSMTVAAMKEYLKEPADWNFGLQQKKLMCSALELPEEAVNTGFTIGDMMEFAAGLQVAGDEGFETLQDPQTWRLVKMRGRSAKTEMERIITDVWGQHLGVPESVLFKLSRQQLADAVVGLQKRGLEYGLTQEEFWTHYLSSPDKEQAYGWARKAEQAHERQKERENAKKMAAFRKAVAARQRELDELNRLRDLDRQKKVAEQIRRRRRRRRRRRLRARVTTLPEEIQVVSTYRVSTPWGTNYFLRVYDDETSELIKLRDDGTAKVVLRRAQHAYYVSGTQSGKLHVVPVIGWRTQKRPASPGDRSEGHRRGPAGFDQQ